MAAEEVIYFPFLAQPSRRPNSPALFPPEPVAEPPPFAENGRIFVPYDDIPDRRGIRVLGRHSQHSSGVANEYRMGEAENA